jgi:hypothetical protein
MIRIRLSFVNVNPFNFISLGDGYIYNRSMYSGILASSKHFIPFSKPAPIRRNLSPSLLQRGVRVLWELQWRQVYILLVRRR